MTEDDHIVTELAELIEREYPEADAFLDAEYSMAEFALKFGGNL